MGTLRHRTLIVAGGVWLALGAAQAGTLEGEAQLEAKSYANAYLELLPPAQAGDPRAQFLMGQLSDNGYGPIQLDAAEAARWYRRSADQDYGEAQFALAQAYAFGRGVASDKDESLRWLRRAAVNNFSPAQLSLAKLLDEGRGMPKNFEEATIWVNRAAELGDADAQYLFAERLSEGKGIAADRRAAFAWFKRAAAQGHPAALYRLGRIALKREMTIDENIMAYTLLTLALQRGTDEIKADATRERTELTKSMTPGDVANAMAKVKAWKPVPEVVKVVRQASAPPAKPVEIPERPVAPPAPVQPAETPVAPPAPAPEKAAAMPAPVPSVEPPPPSEGPFVAPPPASSQPAAPGKRPSAILQGS
jgi:TPR repeat protein